MVLTNIKFFLFFYTSLITFCFASNVTYDRRSLIINGQRKLLISAAIHYPRSVPAVTLSLFHDILRQFELRHISIFHDILDRHGFIVSDFTVELGLYWTLFLLLLLGRLNGA